jgi:chemotaxis signal transduction protein
MWQKPKPVSHMPEHMTDVIDLRGLVVSILYLRHYFKIKCSYDKTTTIIVVQIETPTNNHLV